MTATQNDMTGRMSAFHIVVSWVCVLRVRCCWWVVGGGLASGEAVEHAAEGGPSDHGS